MKRVLFSLLGLVACSLHAVDNDEEKVIELVAKNLSIAFDVGAHGGEWTDLVLKHNPTSEVYLFEPASFLFNSLERKYEQNSNISVFHLGLSNIIGSLTLYNPGSPLAGYHFRNGCHDQNSNETVPVTTLDVFCVAHHISHIDLLKIDTEGAELDILQGASELLATHSIDVIQFEYGGTYLDAKITLEEVFKFLMSYGYKLFVMENGMIKFLDQWEQRLENYNLTNYCAYSPKKFHELLNRGY